MAMMPMEDQGPPDGQETGQGGAEQEGPQMSVQDAQKVIQQLKIPPDILPMLAAAIEALDDAGLIQEPGEQAPKSNPLDDAINAAKVTHGMMPAPPQPGR